MDELCGFHDHDNKENLAFVPELGSQAAQKVCAMYICKMRSPCKPEATPTLPLLAGPGRKAGRFRGGQCAVRQRAAAARRACSRVRLQRSPRFYARPDASIVSHSTVDWAVQDLAHGRAWRQLVQQRDEAVEQRRRLEASRNELARQQGQFKGLIAKVGAASLRARACRLHPRARQGGACCRVELAELAARGRLAQLEGAVSSGEKRLHSLTADLEAAKARAAGSRQPEPARPAPRLQWRPASTHPVLARGQGGGGARKGPAARRRSAKGVVCVTSWAPQRIVISCGLAVLTVHTRAAAITAPLVHTATCRALRRRAARSWRRSAMRWRLPQASRRSAAARPKRSSLRPPSSARPAHCCSRRDHGKHARADGQGWMSHLHP